MVVAVLIETGILLVFCAALLSMRRTLGPRTFSLWVLLCVLRGAASLAVLQHLAIPGYHVLLVYTPVQLAFAFGLLAVALHLEEQKGQVQALREHLATRLERDPLTELANRSALDRWMEEDGEFTGTVVVCDLDDFKALNDRLGHLVGDEILRDVGQLIRASIRHEDRAFRWGGDEFVICFHTRDRTLVEERLRTLERRLLQFRIRHHGPEAIRVSWGMAAASPGRPLRETVDEADQLMLEGKRQRRAAMR
ncbi:MAG: diguanylate cyclase [Acidobacteriota bacterium]